MRAKSSLVVVLGVILAVIAGGPTEAKKAIKPKGGGYIGPVTNKNGKGKVQLVYATFNFGHGDQKGLQLFSWTGILKCGDGSKRDVTSTVFAPLKGVKFSGKSSSGSQTTMLSGRFTANTKLKGTVRVVEKGSSPAAKCDTGPVTFKAHLR
jgi:hypothetical protein